MKRLVIVIVILLVLGGLAFGGIKMALSGSLNGLCKTRAPLFLGFRPALLDSICVAISSRATLKCNFDTHTCENFIPQNDSGNFKITITVNGQPGKGMEIDLWFKPSPGGESFVKNTDTNGVALFEGIPPGTYYPSTNLSNFPKEYGNAYQNWTWTNVEIVKGKTTEIKMDLHSSP